MKRFVTLLAALLVLCLAGCGTLSSTYAITGENSSIHAQADIYDAVDAVEKYFRRNFKGCTLTELGYAGDDTLSAQKEWARQYDADECILLVGSFETDGNQTSLNNNSTYKNYKWILTRSYGGKWEVKTAGYG